MTAFSGHKDLAYSTVLTAPAPALSGTSLTLAAGGGALMPSTLPFYVTAAPASTLPIPLVAEVMLVTNLVGDVVTVTRAQGGTTAKAIAAGWQFYNGVASEWADEIEAAINADETALSDHISDPTGAHAASAISAVDAGGYFTSNDLEGITQELGADVGSLPGGAGSPTGVVTPAAIGQVYVDTTTGGLFIAVGVTNADWRVVGGVVGGLNTGVESGVGFINALPNGQVNLIASGHGAIGLVTQDGEAGNTNGVFWNATAAVDGQEELYVQTGAAGEHSLIFDASGDLSVDASVVILEGDARLSNARTPTAHVHAGEDITSGTVADARIASTIARDSEVAADYVAKATYDANTILKADSDNTPAALTMGASTILARLAAGNIVAATPTETKTLLAVAVDDLTDAVVATPLVGQGLLYDSATSTFRNSRMFCRGIAPTGTIAETMGWADYIGGWSETAYLTSKTVIASAIGLYKGEVVTNILITSGNTALNTGVHQYVALCDDNLGSASATAYGRLVQSADGTNGAWGSNTEKPFAMSSPYTVTKTGIYYVTLLIEATTCPTLVGTNASYSRGLRFSATPVPYLVADVNVSSIPTSLGSIDTTSKRTPFYARIT